MHHVYVHMQVQPGMIAAAVLEAFEDPYTCCPLPHTLLKLTL